MKTNNFIYKVFPYTAFNETNFINYIMENFSINSKHSLFVKFGFNNNSIFLMSGSQIGVPISDSHNIEYYNHIYNIIISRLEDRLDEYNFDYAPDTIVLFHKPLVTINGSISADISSGLENVPFSSLLRKIKDPCLNKSVFKASVLRKNFNTKYLPLTLNKSNLGFLVEGDLKSAYINQLTTTSLNTNVQLPLILGSTDLLKKCDIFIKTIKLDLRDVRLTLIIISCSIQDYIENFGLNSIKNITNYNSKLNSGYVRFVFDLNSGVCLLEAIDLIVSPDVLIRNMNNYSITIKNNQIIDISRFIKLDYIKPPRITPTSMANPNIGVLDVETFVNSKGLSQVYAIGFGTLNSLQDGHVNTYYLSDFGPGLNSDLLIITCINSMLESKYNNYYWYIHNMGRFDMVFIYKTLEEFNLQSNTEYYKFRTTYKDGKMLKLTVSCKLGSKIIKITFIDSYNILSSSLDTLTKDFNVNYLKRDFPYKFVNEKTLDYQGQTPDIKYFNKISISEYKELFKLDKWSLKAESLDYLKADILGLLEVLDKFKSDLFIEHNLDLTEGLTISRLALNKYLKSYMKNSKIPLINKLNQFNFIYSGYYGGRTEVFQPYGVNLKYYDINSLYPKAALNNMAGLNCYYLKSTTDKGLNLDNLFGVFKAKVKTNNNYLGLLPVKTNYGLTFPIGEYIGIWPTPELKYAKNNGYDIQILEGYGFEEIPSYFTEYVLDLYDLKTQTIGSKKLINKSLLNNLLGRFGLNIIKPISKILNKSKLDYLLTNRKINSIQEINSDTFLVNYNPLVDFDICLTHGVDYTKALIENNNSNIEKNIDLFQDVSIIISALVTSYARVYMLKIMKDIINAGGSIYYTDTDSIITDIELDSTLIGKELGKFKLEYDIKEGYFISNKTYCLLLNNGNTIIKCKGIKNDSLTLNDFKTLYFGSTDVCGLKKSTLTDLSKGSVIIQDKKILIQHNVYNKREKIFNREGLWVNTKPLKYNNVETRILQVN